MFFVSFGWLAIRFFRLIFSNSISIENRVEWRTRLEQKTQKTKFTWIRLKWLLNSKCTYNTVNVCPTKMDYFHNVEFRRVFDACNRIPIVKMVYSGLACSRCVRLYVVRLRGGWLFFSFFAYLDSLMLLLFLANLQRIAASQAGSFLYFASSPVCLFAVLKSTRHIFEQDFGVLFTIFCCVCNRLHASEGMGRKRQNRERIQIEARNECVRDREVQRGRYRNEFGKKTGEEWERYVWLRQMSTMTEKVREIAMHTEFKVTTCYAFCPILSIVTMPKHRSLTSRTVLLAHVCNATAERHQQLDPLYP